MSPPGLLTTTTTTTTTPGMNVGYNPPVGLPWRPWSIIGTGGVTCGVCDLQTLHAVNRFTPLSARTYITRFAHTHTYDGIIIFTVRVNGGGPGRGRLSVIYIGGHGRRADAGRVGGEVKINRDSDGVCTTTSCRNSYALLPRTRSCPGHTYTSFAPDADICALAKKNISGVLTAFFGSSIRKNSISIANTFDCWFFPCVPRRVNRQTFRDAFS